MRLIKVAGLLALAVFSSQTWAIEDTPENREREARRYEQTVDTKALMNGAFEAMSTSFSGNKSNPLVPVVLQFMREEIMTPDWLETFYHQQYVKYFTANELKALADFYSTPEGRSTLQKMPQMMATSAQQMMPAMQARMKEKEGLLKQRVEAFYAAHPELRPKK